MNEFDRCREHEIPACGDACPFRLDILDLHSRITGKRFNAAYKTLRDRVVFPGIVSEICPGYCQTACVRGALEDPVQIRFLEKSIVKLATRKEPNSYNLPARDTRAAVIGAGISGLAFALKMASRKFNVTVFEREQEIGGCLSDVMNREDYLTEFQLQFMHEKYELLTDTLASVDPETGTVSAGGKTFDHFDIIYIATGKDGDDFGIEAARKVGSTCILRGGRIKGADLMHALADGINMAAVADEFIRTGALNLPIEPEPTKCVADEFDLRNTAGIPAASAKTECNEENCLREAERCIRCRCNACESYCDIMGYYKKWPIKMRDEISNSVKPAGSLVHKCPSRKYIAACTGCRILEETCPENIELCSMIRAARHQMTENGKMPAAYKQYFLRDMEFANGPYASIAKAPNRHSPDLSKDSYAFFPGCSLGAMNPDYVIKPYRWLREHYPGCGLLLQCCCVPAEWAGDGVLHSEAISQLKSRWEAMGRPVLITACLSCDRHLKEQLPEIDTITLYELMAEKEFPAAVPGETTFSIFDPCSAHGRASVQEAVRRIAESIGANAVDLPRGDNHGCCGFGGQGMLAQPNFSKYLAERNAAMSDNPYIVYCANCRDVFTGSGKAAVHILDLAFDIDPDGEDQCPGVLDRRSNRVTLKEMLLKEMWGETMADKPEPTAYELVMSREIESKVNSLRIIEEDICDVIRRAERTGRRTRSPETGHYKAYSEIGAITLWVEYGMGDDNVREIFNVYTHRMKIKLEAVFNGRKTDEQE